MQVRFYPPYSLLVGLRELTIEIPNGTTVRDLFKELGKRYPPMRRHIFPTGRNTDFPGYISVFLNGQQVGPEEQLPADGLIEVISAISGGGPALPNSTGGPD